MYHRFFTLWQYLNKLKEHRETRADRSSTDAEEMEELAEWAVRGKVNKPQWAWLKNRISGWRQPTASTMQYFSKLLPLDHLLVTVINECLWTVKDTHDFRYTSQFSENRTPKSGSGVKQIQTSKDKNSLFSEWEKLPSAQHTTVKIERAVLISPWERKQSEESKKKKKKKERPYVSCHVLLPMREVKWPRPSEGFLWCDLRRTTAMPRPDDSMWK